MKDKIADLFDMIESQTVRMYNQAKGRSTGFQGTSIVNESIKRSIEGRVKTRSI